VLWIFTPSTLGISNTGLRAFPRGGDHPLDHLSALGRFALDLAQLSGALAADPHHRGHCACDYRHVQPTQSDGTSSDANELVCVRKVHTSPLPPAAPDLGGAKPIVRPESAFVLSRSKRFLIVTNYRHHRDRPVDLRARTYKSEHAVLPSLICCPPSGRRSSFAPGGFGLPEARTWVHPTSERGFTSVATILKARASAGLPSSQRQGGGQPAPNPILETPS